MKLSVIGLAVTLAASLIVVALAAAHVKHYPTSITATGTSAGPPGWFYDFGRVQSPKAACRTGRKMKLIAHYPDGSHKVLDTGQSSRNGAYAFVADFTGSDKGRITAARKDLRKRGICDAGSVGAD